MSYGVRYPSLSGQRSRQFPSAVKWLLIVNIALFVVYYFAVRVGYGNYFYYFGLIPRAVVELFAVWQLFTYMFLHDPLGFSHILFNMLTLYIFGRVLESDWGSKRFLQFYLICGVGAALCVIIANALFGNMDTRTIGASGAIYGVLLAYGLLYPEQIVLFSFLFPIKAKYFVMIIGAIAFLSSFGGSGSGVSHVAHLGGMGFGYLYLKSRYARLDLFASLEGRYREWRMRRAKRKFQVYLRKRGSDPNRFVN